MKPVQNPPAAKRTSKDIRREETRARLVDAGRRLFADRGYDNVSVTEIARDAGVTHAMINVYFGGKAGLLYEIVRQTNALQYVDTVDPIRADTDALGQLEDILLAWLTGDTEDTRLLAVMQSYSWVWPAETEQDNLTVRKHFKDAIAALVAHGCETGEFRASLDPALTAKSIWALYTWGTRSAIFEGATARECHRAIMAQINQLLLDGAKP